MQSSRRRFVKTVGAAVGALPVAGAGIATATSRDAGRAAIAPLAFDFLDPRRHQAAPAGRVQGVQGRAEGIEAFAFDAYGTLFDVFSVIALCEELFPGNGDALAQRWRAKQLQYSLLRSLRNRSRKSQNPNKPRFYWGSRDQKPSETGWQQQKRLAVRLAETLLSQERWRSSNPWVALSTTEAHPLLLDCDAMHGYSSTGRGQQVLGALLAGKIRLV